MSKNGLCDDLAQMADEFKSARPPFSRIRHIVLFGLSPGLGTGVAGDGAASDFWTKPFKDAQFECYRLIGNALSQPGSLKTSLLAQNAVLVAQVDGSWGRSVVYSEGEQPESRGYAIFNQLAQDALKLTIASKNPKAEHWRRLILPTSPLHDWLVGLQLWAAAANHTLVSVQRNTSLHIPPATQIKMGDGTISQLPTPLGPDRIALGPPGCYLSTPENSEQREFLIESLSEAYTQTMDCDVFTASVYAIRWLLEPPEQKVRLANEERDRWLHEQFCKVEIPQKTVLRRLEQECQRRGWRFIRDINAAKQAANRWANLKNRPLIPKRQHGRPSKKAK